jgi:hypothetical protein
MPVLADLDTHSPEDFPGQQLKLFASLPDLFIISGVNVATQFANCQAELLGLRHQAVKILDRPDFVVAFWR